MARDYETNEAEEARVGQWTAQQHLRMDRRFADAMREAIAQERQQRDEKDKARDSKQV